MTKKIKTKKLIRWAVIESHYRDDCMVYCFAKKKDAENYRKVYLVGLWDVVKVELKEIGAKRD